MRREGKVVSLVRGLPAVEGESTLAALPGLVEPAPAAKRPFGDVTLAKEPELQGDGEWRLANGRYENAHLGVSVAAPPGFVQDKDVSPSLGLQSKTPLAIAVLAAENTEPTEPHRQVMIDDAVRTFANDAVMRDLQQTSTGELDLGWGKGWTVTWGVPDRPGKIRVAIVPACGGRKAYAMLRGWADAAGERTLLSWLRTFDVRGAPASAFCSERGALRAAAHAPPPEGFVVVPLQAFILRAQGDGQSASAQRLAADVPRIVEDLDPIGEQAGVAFALDGDAKTVELPTGDLAPRLAAPPDSPGKAGFHVFFVHDADDIRISLGAGDLAVLEQPTLRPIDGQRHDPRAREVARLIAGMLCLAPSKDDARLMAPGTTGALLDATEASAFQAAALAVPGAQSFSDAVTSGAFPDAVAAIRARAIARDAALP